MSSTDPVCEQLVETYFHLLKDVKMSDVANEISEQELRSRIVGRLGKDLFDSPACILCYWLMSQHVTEVTRTWPDERLRADFDLVRADLGVA